MESETYGEVVICGERFLCLSPKGCGVHTYSDGYNLDIKDARNDRPNVEVTYRARFNAFVAKHQEQLASIARRQETLLKMADITEHQLSRQRKVQEQAKYKKKCNKEAAAAQEQALEEAAAA
jgi:hypothetical protein